MKTMTETPQDKVARLFMEHKGYPDIRPYEVEKVDDDACWYFYYDLPEGRVELEVYYDFTLGRWECTTTGFVAG